MNENWKDINLYDGRYLISDMGRVKSIGRIIGAGKGYWKPESILSQFPDKDGYLKVSLCIGNRKSFYQSVHKLVVTHFITDVLPEGFHICHKNGNRADNRLDNLYIGNLLTNTLDRYKHGFTRLSIDDVIKIRSLLGTMPQKEIAGLFNVPPSYISKISTGDRAKFINKPNN